MNARVARPFAARPRTPATDSDLLARFARERDEAAFAELVARHGRLVRGVARRVLGRPDAADDVFQATFLLLAAKAGAVRWGPTVGPWLYQAAWRIALKARRRLARRPTAPLADCPAAGPPVAWDDVRAALDAELARLPAALRDPLVLCYLEELTRDEAAARLGWPLSTLRGRLERGRERLRVRLGARGLALPAALAAVLLSDPPVSAGLAGATARAAVEYAVTSAAPPSVAGLLAGGPSARRITAVVLALAACGVGAVGLTVPSDPPRPASSAEPPPAAAAAAAADAHGDPLPPGAVARLGTVRFRFGRWPFHVLPSPDGKALAVFGANGRHVETLSVLDAATGRPLRTIGLAGAKVESAQWMPDGRGFAVLKLDTAAYAVWEFTDEKAAPPAVIDAGKIGHIFAGTFAVVTVSPDGKLVAGASRTRVRATPDRLEVWAVTPGAPLRAAPPRLTIDAADGFVWLGFTPDSKRLVGVTRHREPDRPGAAGPGQPVPVVPGAAAGTAKATVWDAATGKELLTFEVPGGVRQSYAIAPGGATLFAAGDAGRVAAIDLATGRERFAADALPPGENGGRARYVSHLALTPDGRTLLAVENMAAVAALDAATGLLLWRHTDRDARQVYALGVLPDGKRIALGCVDGRVVYRDVATGAAAGPAAEYRGWFDAVAIEGSGRVAVTAGRDGVFRRWDLASGRELGTVKLAGFDGFTAVAFSPDRRAVVGSGWEGNKPAAVVADAATGRVLARLEADARHLTEATIYGGRPAAWFADGSVLVAAGNRAVRYAPDGSAVRTYAADGVAEGAAAYGVAVSPDGRRVAVVGRGPRGGGPVGGWVAVFDAATGAPVRSARAPRWLVSVGFTADGECAVVTGDVYPPSPRPGGGPDEANTATAVGLFDPADGAIRYPFADPTDGTAFRQASVVSVAPGGHQAAVVEHDDSVTVYELASGAVRRRLRGHVNQVFQLAFTPDGSRLASVSWDGTGLVWDVGPPKPAPPPSLTDADRRKRWERLASGDAADAHRAMGELASDPAGAVTLLKEVLRPAPPPADADVDRAVAGLDAAAFADREAAAKALDGYGGAALARVRERLPGVGSAEVRQRLTEFLARYDRRDRLTGGRLRERRAVELLEAIGGSDAATLLRAVARGGDGPLARDAAAAARRVADR